MKLQYSEKRGCFLWKIPCVRTSLSPTESQFEISPPPSPNHLSIDKNALLWNGRGPTKLSHHHPPPLTALWSLNSSEGRNPLSMAEETVSWKDNSGHWRANYAPLFCGSWPHNKAQKYEIENWVRNRRPVFTAHDRITGRKTEARFVSFWSLSAPIFAAP